MDFNDIQNAWNNEKPENVVLPSNLEKIQSANTPLDKIRTNLKNEFVYQIVSIIFMGAIPIICHFNEQMIFLYYLIYSLFLAVCVYYLVKLYFFFKRLNATTLKTKDSLYETYFDIRLNMELYKTFGFSLTPFIVVYLLGFYFYGLSEKSGLLNHEFTNGQLFGFFAIIVFTVLSMGISLEWWVQKFYGKYAKEIKKVIDELKEE
ncbi:hypothetical protein [Flavobacterium tyrosinilyticum]|uniref:hypothetical protein n=1 Tax=Flavobacterium tyrosinilyticum TaxID=1658740 RepID=UPI0020302B7D|nr:hypothetical protein [Flavobacterium tyrosinilyticum]MCM0665654.1 hypothetical protein [Flavobacterium tyrosinilyticum]